MTEFMNLWKREKEEDIKNHFSTGTVTFAKMLTTIFRYPSYVISLIYALFAIYESYN